MRMLYIFEQVFDSTLLSIYNEKDSTIRVSPGLREIGLGYPSILSFGTTRDGIVCRTFRYEWSIQGWTCAYKKDPEDTRKWVYPPDMNGRVNWSIRPYEDLEMEIRILRLFERDEHGNELSIPTVDFIAHLRGKGIKERV